VADRGERCSDLSRGANERLAGTAPWIDRWLLVEVPGRWARDVGSGDGLPDDARATVQSWLASPSERRRVLFVRRRGRPMTRRLAFVVRAQEAAREVRRIELTAAEELGGLDLEDAGEPTDTSLVVVCGHGSRDACCAARGPAVYDCLAPRLGEEELWISSHQGGHRFAANVIVLPVGLQLGRVEPEEAGEIVGRALAGQMELDRYRGRTCYPPAVQAAEHAVRSARGLDRVSELSLVAFDGTLATFSGPGGEQFAARVEETRGPAVPGSCGEQPKPKPTFVVQLV
jgi:hypothetical protein